jgi:putative transposase
VETLVGDKFFFINAWLDWLRGEVAKHGGKFIAIGRWVRSTWTCHRCLCAVESCGLEVREWECPQCHQLHERDVNAACNIMREGLKIYYSQRELLNA